MDETLARLLRVEVLIFLIPIVAIIMVVGSKMLNRFFEHRERMAKIDAGIDPDQHNVHHAVSLRRIFESMMRSRSTGAAIAWRPFPIM